MLHYLQEKQECIHFLTLTYIDIESLDDLSLNRTNSNKSLGTITPHNFKSLHVLVRNAVFSR